MLCVNRGQLDGGTDVLAAWQVIGECRQLMDVIHNKPHITCYGKTTVPDTSMVLSLLVYEFHRVQPLFHFQCCHLSDEDRSGTVTNPLSSGS